MVPCLVIVRRMCISTMHAYQQSPRFVAYLLALCCILSTSGCVTVDMGEHDVSPEVQSEIETPFAKINVSVVDDEVITTAILNALDNEGIEAEFIDGTVCFEKQLGGKGAYVTLDQLLQPHVRVKSGKCDTDFIVVVGKEDNNNQTDVAATIVSYKGTGEAETMHIHAEGNVRGFLPAPVPYLSLFYFVSTPDTEGSAIEVLAEAIVKKIEMEIDDRPVRLLYLKSDNLQSVARQMALQMKSREEKSNSMSDPKVKKTETFGDTGMSRYNPFAFYVQMNKEAAEEGNPMVHNPIGQVMIFMASVIAAPTIFILDKVFELEDQTTSESVSTVTAEEESAIAGASEAINRHDWEAGYRALEDCLHSRNAKVREFCLYQINTHSELKEAAKETFSESALRKSKALHGDSALEIERKRYAIYEGMATQEELASASINMHKIFPDYQYITDWKLRVEVGAYCPNADLGHSDAQKRIADIYSYGLYNVKKDMQRAYVWYSLATNGGDSDAEIRLAVVTSKLTQDQLIEADHLLEQWEPGQCKKDLFRNSLGVAPEINSE